MRRAGSRVLILLGTCCLAGAALPVVTVSAAAEPGSGFASFSLAANAPAIQVRQVDGGNCGGEPAATGGCEGVVPEAVSTLRNGPVGYALSSVVWPGVLAGNAGSLIIVAGGDQVPPQATALNSPVRAEARSGGDDKEVVNDDYPGTRMVAQASGTRVSAAASVENGAALPVGSTGASSGRTVTEVTGVKAAVAEAHSTVKDVSLAGGVVTIASVTSDAKATTDGVRADATGATTTSGVKIAGIPVTIDEKGVTVAGTNAPQGPATALVNTAITNAGMTIAVSEPQKVVEGGTVSYDSGSVVFFWEQQPGTSMTAILGGARVTASASPEFSFGGGTTGGGTTGTTTGIVSGTTGGSTTGSGGGPVSPPLTTTGGPAPVTPPVPQVAPPTGLDGLVEAAARRPLPGGLSPAVVVLGLAGAGLLAAGFRRLPDRVLEAPATVCLLEDTP